MHKSIVCMKSHHAPTTPRTEVNIDVMIWVDTRTSAKRVNNIIISFVTLHVILCVLMRGLSRQDTYNKVNQFWGQNAFNWSPYSICNQLCPSSCACSWCNDGYNNVQMNCTQTSLEQTWCAKERNTNTPLGPLYRRVAWRDSMCFGPSWNSTELTPS